MNAFRIQQTPKTAAKIYNVLIFTYTGLCRKYDTGPLYKSNQIYFDAVVKQAEALGLTVLEFLEAQFKVYCAKYNPRHPYPTPNQLVTQRGLDRAYEGIKKEETHVKNLLELAQELDRNRQDFLKSYCRVHKVTEDEALRNPLLRGFLFGECLL